MKIDEEARAPDTTGVASDPLGAPDSPEEGQEERDEYFRPEHLPAEERARIEQAVQAGDSFIESHPTYKPTDENRQVILDYLADHDLQISPAALGLAWEQLQDSLELEPETKTPEESIAHRVREASTESLARKTEEELPEKSEEESAEEEPVAKRGGKLVAFRNGRRVAVAG